MSCRLTAQRKKSLQRGEASQEKVSRLKKNGPVSVDKADVNVVHDERTVCSRPPLLLLPPLPLHVTLSGMRGDR